MDNNEFKFAIKFKIGSVINEPNTTCAIDQYRIHSQSCKLSTGDRKGRQDAVRDILIYYIKKSIMQSSKTS